MEAALYGRYLGYDVDIYERGQVGEHLALCGHVRMFTPLGQNASPLGLAALAAQYPSWQPPAPGTMITCGEFVRGYLRPLAESDLLIDGLHERTEVQEIGREGLCKEDLAGDETRGDGLFRLLVEERQPGHPAVQRVATADIVIDASGTMGCPRPLGHGGMSAIGESMHRVRIEYGVPDILGGRREHYAGQRVLVVGTHWAATHNVIALACLAREAMGTHVTWISGRAAQAAAGPIDVGPFGTQAEFRQLMDKAAQLAKGSSPAVVYWPETTVDALHSPADGREFTVTLSGQHAGAIEVERIIGNVGYGADHTLDRQLQVTHCPITGAPAPASLAAEADHGGELQFILHEPNFYVLGAKSQGQAGDLPISQGLAQIKQLYAIIGDRATLDLYATMGKLVPPSR